MTAIESPVSHPHQFFIDGAWVAPSSDAQFDVIDSGTEELYFRVAEAKPADMERAIAAARKAFDDGPWPSLSHEERAEYLRGFAKVLRSRVADIGEIWPRQAGVLQSIALMTAEGEANLFDYYAGLASGEP
jgi:acyl-CoA reductase-like NAD-dependent aldehyde dehydrogenase